MNELDELPHIAASQQQTAAAPTENAPPEEDLSLPGGDESLPPEFTPDQYPQGVQEGMASVMANPSDLYRFQHTIANGGSLKDAQEVGHSGIGTWGDIVATYKTPMVALKRSTPGLNAGSLVKVTGPNGDVVAKVADTIDHDTGDDISLNPAAALAVGHPGGMVKMKWEHLTSGDVAQNPTLAGPPQPMSARKVLGSTTSEPLEIDPNATLSKDKNSDGTYKRSDGWNVDFKGRTAYKDIPGVGRFMMYSNGTIKQVSKSGEDPETKAKEASDTEYSKMTGKTRSNFASDQEYQAAKEDALSSKIKPKTYRDTNTGILFDISDLKNPHPVDLPGNPASIDVSQVRQGDWDSVPEDIRDMAKNIASYQSPKLSGFALRSPYFQQLLKVISKVDPSFDYKYYDARQAFLKDFSGTGKMGQNRLAFNTALDHMGKALSSSDALKHAVRSNDSDQFSNFISSHGQAIKGNTALNDYQTDAGTLVDEYAKAVTGAAATDAEKANWHGRLIGTGPLMQTSAQRESAMKHMSELLASRMNEIKTLYKQTMGREPEFSMLSPEAEQTLRRLGANDIVAKFGSDGGKKPYMPPDQNNFSLQPFPGSTGSSGSQEQTGNLKVFADPSTGAKFVQSPDGSMVPYTGEYTPGTP